MPKTKRDKKKRKPRKPTSSRKSRNTDSPPQETPSTNGDTGRTKKGRFAPGNKCGKGNPYAKQTAQLRAAFYEALTPDDIREVALSLLVQAKKGNVVAIKELLLRVLGQYPEIVEDTSHEEEEWISRTSLSDGSYILVPEGTDPVDAYNAHIRTIEPEGSDEAAGS